MISMSRRIDFAAIALPAISPPPPIGITSASRSGPIGQHFDRDRALARR